MEADAANYLRKLVIEPNTSDEILLSTLSTLLSFIQEPPPRNDPLESTNQRVYAAAVIQTCISILLQRNQNVDTIFEQIQLNTIEQHRVTRQILDDPIKWTILNGVDLSSAKSIVCANELYKSLCDESSTTFSYHLMRKIAKTKCIQMMSMAEPELQYSTEAHVLLARLHSLAAEPKHKEQFASVIENVVTFRSSVLNFRHIMEIFLIEQPQWCRPIAAHIYGGFIVRMLRRDDAEFLTNVWRHMIDRLDVEAEVVMFYRCCRLTGFYDCLIAQITAYLTQLRCVEWPMGELDYVCNDAVFKSVPFRSVARVTTCLMADESPVRKKFGQHIESLALSDDLKENLFRFLIYE